MTIRASLIACALLLSADALYAQTLIGPTDVLAWGPSADHDALSTDKQALVTGYELDFLPRTPTQATCPAGGSVTMPIVVPAGKPAPAGGEIRSAAIRSLPGLQAEQRYCAYVRAVGPGGTSSRLGGVGPFVWAGPLPVPAVPTGTLRIVTP